MILQTIHKYKRTLFGAIFVLILAVAMSGFGLQAIDTMRTTTRDTAVSVGDVKVGFGRVAELKKMTGLTGQALADRVVNSAVLDTLANEMGLRSGEDAIRIKLETELFRGEINPDQYRAFLRQIGMSASQFEANLHEEASRGQLIRLLQDLAIPSTREARAFLERQETQYTVKSITIDPASYLPKTTEPSAEEIEQYYNDHSADFDVPPGASYDYVLFTPEKYESAVEILPEDIELYYTDNQKKFTTPEAVKVRRIRILLPPNADDAQKADAKERANQALSRAKAGESFDTLALEFSDDTSSKTNGGDIGWIEKGKLSPAIDAEVFKYKEPALAELISTEYGYEVMKIEEHRAESAKSLDSVKEEIRSILAKEEAPAYAATRAQDLFSEWKKSTASLTEFASSHGLTVASTKGVLTREIDPEDAAKGLTAAVVDAGQDTKQIVEAPNYSVIVGLKEYRESDIAPLSVVREKIVSILKNRKARELARQSGTTLLDELKAANAPDLEAAAQKVGGTISSLEKISARSADAPLFKNEELRKRVLSAHAASAKPLGVFDVDGKFVLPAVVAVQLPEEKDIADKVELYKQVAAAQIADQLVQSVVNRAKQDREIFISPQVLSES